MGNRRGTASRPTENFALAFGQACFPPYLACRSYLDGGVFCALFTADGLTGVPCSLAWVRRSAQLASLVSPGSMKAKMAAKGDSRPSPAPMAPCVMAGLLFTPTV